MHGGARPGSGRKKNSVAKATAIRQEMIAKATAEGVTPLDFMLKVLRDESRTFAERFDAAKAAAPYTHPKLAAIEHSGGMTITQEDALTAIEQATSEATAGEHGNTH